MSVVQCPQECDPGAFSVAFADDLFRLATGGLSDVADVPETSLSATRNFVARIDSAACSVPQSIPCDDTPLVFSALSLKVQEAVASLSFEGHTVTTNAAECDESIGGGRRSHRRDSSAPCSTSPARDKKVKKVRSRDDETSGCERRRHGDTAKHKSEKATKRPRV
eukprot:TRINITY_DN38683_c0_g1_i1.p2 TRINITY_DN38683_c0_g1~~TRINITY_DN38683_c0_g1_i1.p2  ORF type:complete len:165 (-),score=9.96 TRINITY_DN38683_c0_g1_i1:61-555(-)